MLDEGGRVLRRHDAWVTSNVIMHLSWYASLMRYGCQLHSVRSKEVYTRNYTPIVIGSSPQLSTSTPIGGINLLSRRAGSRVSEATSTRLIRHSSKGLVTLLELRRARLGYLVANVV
jgi:hypothetical protein